MQKPVLFVFSLFLLSCSATRYYVVRHAEKEATQNMATDVPLSAAGQERAAALREVLKKKNIRLIYSTQTSRTLATARPLSEALGVPIQTYDAGDTLFAARLLQHTGGNVLIVGHSNTVDDLVNRLAGRHLLQDLSDTRYGDLFIVQKKNGKTSFSVRHFGRR